MPYHQLSFTPSFPLSKKSSQHLRRLVAQGSLDGFVHNGLGPRQVQPASHRHIQAAPLRQAEEWRRFAFLICH